MSQLEGKRRGRLGEWFVLLAKPVPRGRVRSRAFRQRREEEALSVMVRGSGLGEQLPVLLRKWEKLG